MDTTIIVPVGMAAAAVGFFVASYYRFSRPSRSSDRNRQVPQLSTVAVSVAAGADHSRRTPSV